MARNRGKVNNTRNRNGGNGRQNKTTAHKQPVPRGVSAPLSTGVVMRSFSPVVRSAGLNYKDGVVCTHIERISNVGVSATAGAYVNGVIPMIPSRFLWLSALASAYSKYKWLDLEITYVPQCPTTIYGLHGFAFIYDPRDGPIESMTQLSAVANCCQHPVWAGHEGASCLHSGRSNPNAITINPGHNAYEDTLPIIEYETFNALSDADKLLYCRAWCVTATASSNVTSTDVGGLYCRYSVRFFNPVTPTANN